MAEQAKEVLLYGDAITDQLRAENTRLRAHITNLCESNASLHRVREDNERITKQRDELLAAIKKIASYYARGAVRINADVDVPNIACAAIAAVEEKP